MTDHKISCDVARDLMAGYLDGVCSDESRQLVDGHLNGCESCRNFVLQLKTADCAKSRDDEKISYFKRVKTVMELKTVAALVAMAAIVAGVYGYNFHSGNPVNYGLYYAGMPLLMLLSLLVNTDAGRAEYKRSETVLQAGGAVLAGYAVLLNVLIHSFLRCDIPQKLFGLEDAQLGPFYAAQAWIVVAAEFMLLAYYFIAGRKKCVVFTAGQNIAWFGITVAVVFRSHLGEFNVAPEQSVYRLEMLVAVTEAVVTTAVCRVLVKKLYGLGGGAKGKS